MFLPFAHAQPDQRPFITTWKTDAADHTITIPLSGTGMTVHWGDGANSTGVFGPATHTYANPGTYTVSVYGLEAISLGGHPDVTKLVSIDQWGDASWTTMRSAFQGAASMVYAATDVPDLSRVTDMSRMFWGATVFNGNISAWNVSSVADMSWMFRNATSFNQPLNSWDTSSVTEMRGMFAYATSFNGDISTWDVSRVTSMRSMFNDAASFNQDISTWDVSRVTSMRSMFNDASSFNQPLDAWNVSSVTYMGDMFRYAASFNQNLSNWNISSAYNMAEMFANATSFDQNLGGWYIVIDGMSIDRADVPGMVGTISARNAFLDGQNPTYHIEPGGDSDRFAITDGNQLNMVSAAADRTTYTVTIAATGYSVFEDGNNQRTIQVILME